jgi:hypothetical protein
MRGASRRLDAIPAGEIDSREEIVCRRLTRERRSSPKIAALMQTVRVMMRSSWRDGDNSDERRCRMKERISATEERVLVFAVMAASMKSTLWDTWMRLRKSAEKLSSSSLSTMML